MASSLSLVAVPGPPNSVSLAELRRLVVNRRSRTYFVQYYARDFDELEIRYVWQIPGAAPTVIP